MTEKKKQKITYSDATTELDDILREIESGDIDLDVLSDRVERAAALLAVCKKKLAATETKVKKVTDEMSAAMDAGAEGEEVEK